MQFHPRNWFIRASTAALGALALMFSNAPLNAHGNYLNNWQSLYPNSSADDNVIAGTGQNCALCHFSTSGGQNWNAYGWRIRQGTQAGQSVSTAISNAGSVDSDMDPTASTNALEISLNTQPGWTPGANNTRYLQSSTQTNQLPPAAILGLLDPTCGVAVNYCTPGTTSSGCTPSISMSGVPRASFSGACTITVNNVEGAKQGLIFYGTGRVALLWGTSTYLCVKSPTQRTAIVGSGGVGGQCNGQLSIDINAFWAANSGAFGQPITAGQLFEFQGWFRDPPAAKTTNVSTALEVIVCP
jgi:hypothetical protein